VSNVLDLMRFEAGQVVLRRDWQTLDDLVGSALSRIDERLKDYPVDISIPTDLPAVHVDANLVVQIFVNLFDNVVKYTPPGTRVHISAQGDDELVRITVEDEGPGLPAAERARVFEKFQRGNDEGTIVGAGLGLAICRAVVRAHGGDIGAGERPGGGARFQFTLPTTEAAP
jgi:two-component system, OmpR family, sensor histidine kinase KdpD